MSALTITDLSFSYNGSQLFKGVSGTFSSGRPNLVLGPAGTGKTTLLLLLSGFLAHDSGSIDLDGISWHPEGRTGLTFQNPEMLFFHSTVGQEVTFALRQRGEVSCETRGKEWLEKWDLPVGQFWDRHPMKLSAGEKRRVALAACTVFLPELILMDEPTAGLDHEGRLALRQRVCELARDHIVILITHDPEFFLEESGSVLLMQEGSARWFGGGRDLIAASLRDERLFPLPDWYRNALSGVSIPENPPWIKAESVLAFLAAGPFISKERGGEK